MLGFFAVLPPLAALFFVWGDYWWVMWQGKWAALLFGLVLSIACLLGKRVHWSLAPFVFCVLASGVNSFAWNFLARDAVYSCFTLLSLITFFLLLNNKFNKDLLSALATICIFGAVFSFVHPGGFVGNASMNGALIAITLPAMLHYLKPVPGIAAVAFALAIGAIVKMSASVPVGILCAVLGGYIFTERRARFAWFAFPFLLGMGALQGWVFLDSNGRFAAWAHILNWWASSKQYWFGLGVGTGPTIFKHQGILHGTTDHFSIFAHNDFLQLLFENGLVGLASILLLIFYVLKKSRNRPWLFSSVCGYLVCSFLNFPNHLPVHAFVGATLVYLAHGKKTNQV